MDELLAGKGTAGAYAPQERDAPCGVLVAESPADLGSSMAKALGLQTVPA